MENKKTTTGITLYSGPSHQMALSYLKNSIATGGYIRLQMRQRGATWRVWAEAARPPAQEAA